MTNCLLLACVLLAAPDSLRNRSSEILQLSHSRHELSTLSVDSRVASTPRAVVPRWNHLGYRPRVSDDAEDFPVKATLIGAGIGALAGGVYAYGTQSCQDCMGLGLERYTIPLGAIAGGFIGYVVGSISR